MITFETQEDFEEAVMAVIAAKLRLSVAVRGGNCVTGVTVRLSNGDDAYGYLTEGSDSL